MLSNPEKRELLLVRHGISGLLLIPLLLWMIVSFIAIMKDPFEYLPVFFFSPVNAVCGIFFVAIALYHINFDVKYIIYHSKYNQTAKNIMSLLSDFISAVTAVSVVLSILQLHFTGIVVA